MDTFRYGVAFYCDVLNYFFFVFLFLAFRQTINLRGSFRLQRRNASKQAPTRRLLAGKVQLGLEKSGPRALQQGELQPSRTVSQMPRTQRDPAAPEPMGSLLLV